MRRTHSRNIRPQLLDLEARLTPAITLLIDGDGGTSGVETSTAGTTTTFTATSTLASLRPQDILTALQTGDVVIDSGGASLEAGNILWDRSSDNDDFSSPAFNINQNRKLTFRTPAGATGNITFSNDVLLNGSNRVSFEFLPKGNLDLGGATVIGRGLDVTAATGTVIYKNVDLNGAATITATGISTNGLSLFQTQGTNSDITFTGAFTPDSTNPASVRAINLGTLTINDTITTTGSLELEGGNIILGDNVSVGAALTFGSGNVSFGPSAITAAFIGVGESGNFKEAHFGNGTGTVTAQVDVRDNGNLTPGNGAANGTLKIVGNVTINPGGTFDPDLGATTDALDITGNLTIAAGALLGNAGVGTITAAKDIVTISGDITGEFDNAPVGRRLVLAQDAVTITYTDGPGGNIKITPVVPTNAKVATGHDDDGTLYTAKLSGPGTLIDVPTVTGQPSFVLKDTTSLSSLTITTTANGSNSVLAAGQLVAAGGFNGITAATTDFALPVKIGQNVKTFTLRNAADQIFLGGTNANNTTVKAGNLFGITSGSTLSMLTLSGRLDRVVTAPKIGTVTVGSLGGFAQVRATASSIGNVTVNGASIGGLFSAQGSIGAMKFANSYLSGVIDATGPVASITATTGFMLANISAASVGPIKGDRFQGSINTGNGAVASITMTGDFQGSLTAGSLGAVSVKGNLGSGLSAGWNVNGPVSSITAGSLGAFTPFTLVAKSLGSLTTNSVGGFTGSINTGTGAVGTVTIAGHYSGSLTAASVGAVSLKGDLRNDLGTGWNVSGPVASITAAAIGTFSPFTFTARNLGSLTVTGNEAIDLDANVRNATFTINGNDKGTAANAAGFGIKTVTVAGNILDTTFNLKEGSLMSFKTGRFIRSNLYLDYTPGAFDTTLAFETTTAYKLMSFTTTATTLGTTANPLNFAFADSEIAADTLGTVKLSGVKSANSGVPFGLKFNTAGGSVKVASGLAAPLLNTNLTPGLTAIEGDFYFIGV